MISIFNALAHFLVDAVCVAAVLGRGALGIELANAVVVYNTLAFSTQCVLGYILDRYGPCRRSLKAGGLLACAGMVIVAAGALDSLTVMAAACITGLGNSLFHVAGGIVTLKRSGGKAAPLGIFVAPGAFGVTVGTLYPQLCVYLAAALLALAGFGGALYLKGYASKGLPVGSGAVTTESSLGSGAATPESSLGGEEEPFPVATVVLLTAAVAVRAIGGSASVFSWKQGAVHTLLLTLFVFAGKALGGYLCDRIGCGKSAVLSIVPAAVLTAFFAGSMLPALAGQLLINLTMPVTLWMLYLLLPKEPGLAFGLAASALWPGTIIGMFIKLSGPARSILILASFLFGAGAILYADRYIRREK